MQFVYCHAISATSCYKGRCKEIQLCFHWKKLYLRRQMKCFLLRERNWPVMVDEKTCVYIFQLYVSAVLSYFSVSVLFLFICFHIVSILSPYHNKTIYVYIYIFICLYMYSYMHVCIIYMYWWDTPTTIRIRILSDLNINPVLYSTSQTLYYFVFSLSVCLTLSFLSPTLSVLHIFLHAIS